MINKIADSAAQAMAGVRDGATVLIGGFGTAGIPGELIDALIAQGARDLTVVNNNAGNADHGLAALLKAGQVRKIICSFPRQVDSYVFDELYRSGKLELELVPQGNLAERLRAAGAGIGAFFCRCICSICSFCCCVCTLFCCCVCTLFCCRCLCITAAVTCTATAY